MSQDKQPTDFVPRGSIAFFVIMMIFYIVMWLVFYFLMLGRH